MFPNVFFPLRHNVNRYYKQKKYMNLMSTKKINRLLRYANNDIKRQMQLAPFQVPLQTYHSGKYTSAETNRNPKQQYCSFTYDSVVITTLNYHRQLILG